jgi:allantoinase
LQRSPHMVKVFQELGYEIACHGLKWIHYQHTPIEQERNDMLHAMDIMTELMGHRPVGWYTGRDSPNTHQLVADFGGFEYDSDYYGDDLPFWMKVNKTDGDTATQLIVPYTLDANDMRFALPQGFSHGDPFFQYLKDSFDCLYAEGDPNGLNRPKMLNIGIHCRLLGRPGRFMAIKRFVEYIASHEHVWVATRQDIARHWRATHPCPA